MQKARMTRSHLYHSILLLLLLSYLGSCSGLGLRPTHEERLLLVNTLQLMGPEYSMPRLVSGELEVHVSNIVVSQLDSIQKVSEPELLVWSANPLDINTQQVLSNVDIIPAPTDIFLDREYGNEIVFWDVLALGDPGTDVILRRNFQYITFDYRPTPNDSIERQAWGNIPQSIVDRYTRAERFLEQDDDLVDTVFTILGNSTGPVAQARVLYDWVQDHMDYVYPPAERGVRPAYETAEGDCGQYTALFITMARIAGIPARQQSGFNFHPDRQGAHVWSEIYLPVHGWVPVDATRDDGFLHLDNQRLIMSRGLNIPLDRAPEWATFDNSEVECGYTDFMQMYTLVKRGVEAEFRSSRKILRSVEL